MIDLDISQKTDEELVELTLENQGFFAHLIGRYEAKLFRYISRISGVRPEEAEDLLQEVFIKVYQNLNDFDPDLKFSSWIYRITRNHVISEHRKKVSRRDGMVFELDDSLINKLSADFNIEKEVDNKLARQNINKVLGRLDEKYREVLVLKYLEEKDYKEISDILKKPMGTVATLLNRAKKRFREEYIRNGEYTKS